MDVSDHAPQINKGDPIFDDLWSWSCYSLETGFPTLKTSSFSPSSNNELLEKSLDFIDERRESTMV